jgi:hypothetical protein
MEESGELTVRTIGRKVVKKKQKPISEKTRKGFMIYTSKIAVGSIDDKVDAAASLIEEFSFKIKPQIRSLMRVGKLTEPAKSLLLLTLVMLKITDLTPKMTAWIAGKKKPTQNIHSRLGIRCQEKAGTASLRSSMGFRDSITPISPAAVSSQTSGIALESSSAAA